MLRFKFRSRNMPHVPRNPFHLSFIAPLSQEKKQMRFKRSIFLLAAALVGVLLTVQMFAAFNTAEAGRVAAPVSVEPAAAVDVAAW
ncbi:MAG: hypothetical protein KA003_14550, partial [Caldilineaceae bacterium]|nr:hypothetical protein [Caldilineaceae bacterium]MBP8110536.1 hypothetical protein [Caldilineaceae bacterium]